MSRATIVFADGSKKMARNLDDSQFRWYERKVRESEDILRLYQGGITIRDCSNPESLEQARQWKDEVAGQATALQQQLAIARMELSKTDYTVRTVHLRIAFSEIQQQNRLLKRYIFDNDGGETREDMRKELIKAQQYIIRLQSILLERFGITVDEG